MPAQKTAWLKSELRARQDEWGPDSGTDFDSDSDPDSMTDSSASLSVSTDSCSRGSWAPRSDSDSEDEVTMRLDENDFSATATRMNPRLSLRFNNQGKFVRKRPRLLFRAFEPSHGLRARRFLSTSTRITPPPGYTTEEFRNLARRHLCEDKTFASPFLSLTQSPARALSIIATDNRIQRELLIVDYNDLEEKIEQTYGEGHGLWLVPDVYGAHKLNNLTRIHDDRSSRSERRNQKDYTGTGEASCES
ncbi:hypothetical protein CLCR_00937 [Cladophialophora carrionii]|uniref:DUF7587 domain-containing protein n=1 Tax=Cladophialophora carrionii TaxID=86049 RepID=A0A1C1D0W7_9EURO|nr:hypothetical protein CLCR_00937 [Cladophialophora carrionii]